MKINLKIYDLNNARKIKCLKELKKPTLNKIFLS